MMGCQFCLFSNSHLAKQLLDGVVCFITTTYNHGQKKKGGRQGPFGLVIVFFVCVFLKISILSISFHFISFHSVPFHCFRHPRMTSI